MSKKKRIPVDGTAEIVSNTLLGDLLRESGLVGADTGSGRKAPEKTDGGTGPEYPMPDLSRVGKIVLRVQRKGRGGKTVTVLSTPGGGLAPSMLDPLAKELRKALGCGARVEEGSVVLQGDNAERAERWLRCRGAKQVIGC